MTIFRRCLLEIALETIQTGTGINSTFQGLRLTKTLENLIATPMRHHPSICHRDGDVYHRWLVLNHVKPPRQVEINRPRNQDRGSQEISETDLRRDRSQRDRFLANITHLVLEVFAP